MKKLYAPWREKYTNETAKGICSTETTQENECVFCSQLKQNIDKEVLILRRFKYSYVVINKYPYNSGHLLILPLDHSSELTSITKECRLEIIELISLSADILKTVLKTDGINVGLNQGKAAGAGMPSHLHFHVLPRWVGDTNFLPTLSDTKILSVDLKTLYNKLKPEFDKIIF